MTYVTHGVKAEAIASEYLIEHGFIIVDHNWKTKWCEIDLVAQKNNTIFFVEVKYRANNDYGEGLDYITSSKLKQMTRAAEGWVQINDWKDDYQLAALEVSGQEYVITNFLCEL